MSVHCFKIFSPNSASFANFTASVGALHYVCSFSFSYFLRVEVTEASVSVMVADGGGFSAIRIGVGIETFADEVEGYVM